MITSSGPVLFKGLWFCWTYGDAPPLIGCLSGEIRLVSVGSLHPQETVGCMSDAAGQNPVSQHSVDHRALPVTGPEPQRAPSLPGLIQAWF